MAGQFLCVTCGEVGKPRVRNRASSAIEIILWLCFLVLGLIYTLWRMGRKDSYCRACKAQTVIPVDSPVTRQRLAASELMLTSPLRAD